MARLEIEPCSNRTRNGLGHTRAQGLFDGPKGLPLVCGFDQDHTPRIKTKSIEPVTVGTAVIGKPPQRGNEQHRSTPRHATEEGRDEAEGSGCIADSLRHNFVQGSESKTGLWKTGIESIKAKGEDPPITSEAFQSRQQTPQIIEDLGVILIPFECHGPGRLHEAIIEQNKNNSSEITTKESAANGTHFNLSAIM